MQEHGGAPREDANDYMHVEMDALKFAQCVGCAEFGDMLPSDMYIHTVCSTGLKHVDAIRREAEACDRLRPV